MSPIRVACDQAELAVECAAAAASLGLEVQPELVPAPVDVATAWLRTEPLVGVASLAEPTAEQLVQLSAACRATHHRAALALHGAEPALRDLCGDLGLPCVADTLPLAVVLRLLTSALGRIAEASSRGLSELDRARLQPLLHPSADGPRLERGEAGTLLAHLEEAPPIVVGPPSALAAAIAALEAAAPPHARSGPILDTVDAQTVTDVIFGPPRALSDPASKSALAPYGVQLPPEELCSSPSRAASEAARLGFPVRIALASPDLRIWDHPDLAVDGIDNAARVRDVFRQMMTLATARAPEARLLGVTVTAAAVERALLRFEMSPLPEGLVHAILGFADPHGVASRDMTRLALPAPLARIEKALARLRGSELILAGSPTQRRETVEAVGDVLLRVAAFVHDRRQQVERVRVEPLAVLVGGGAEVREACITVGDAFLRSLEASR